IVVLKKDASYKDSNINGLEKQVERLKKEKDENQFKIDKYENASKSLDQLIANQISDNNKKGLGYNVVNKGASENVSKEVKKTSDDPIIEDWASDCDEDETVVLESLNVQKPKQTDQPRKFAKNYKSNDPPLSKGYTFGSGEDSLKLIELMDLCTKLIDKVTILENALKQSKESHVQTLTMLMKKVKRLEDKLKVMNSDAKEYLISEDPVKQGRMEETENA
ncbi:hypothetical protein Tco_0672690, partial [Tanacetum coccineum]